MRYPSLTEAIIPAMNKTAAIALLALSRRHAGVGADVGAQRSSEASKSQPTTVQSSSEKVRDNPAAQYVLVKTVVGKVIGMIDARALPVEPEGYNLLKYCWTAANVLGDWAERAGLTGAMVVRALETRSWAARPGARRLSRGAGQRGDRPLRGQAGGGGLHRRRPRPRARGPGGGPRRASGGRRRARRRSARSIAATASSRSLGLNYTTAPEDGRARFMPYVLHQICQTQQLNADDPVRCDYWMYGKTDGPMSFAGETVYSVRWADGATASGRFDPEQSRSAGTVTLRLRSPEGEIGGVWRPTSAPAP